MQIEDIVEAPFIPLSVILRAHAARRGEAIALADETARLSWADLDTMLDRVAAALQREGVQANEPVAIAASNSVNTALAFLGALRAGAVAAPTKPAVAFEWPPSTRLSYRLQGNYRGPVEGTAQVEWLRQGSRYQVHLRTAIGPVLSRHITSEGELGAQGLVPRQP